MTEQIEQNISEWWKSLQSFLPELALAVVVFIGFWLLGKQLSHVTTRAVRRTAEQESVVNLFARLTTVIMIVIGALIALRILQLDGLVTSLLAGAGILGLALGFAFQDIASNFISGIVIAAQKQLNVGDLIEVNEIFGIIKKIELRNTTVQTLQGQTVLIPNKEIFTNIVTDYTHLGKRRVDLRVGVSYGDDLEKVKDVTLSAINKVDNLADGKEIDVYFEEFGDSSINLVVRYWINFKRQPDFLEAQSQGIMNLKAAYEANDILIPFPITTLDFAAKGGKTLKSQLKK